MPKKQYLILSLTLFLIYSCANDDPSGPSPATINGQWNSDQYIYSPNCGEEEFSFDNYILYLVTVIQEADAETQADIACSFYGQDWCDASPGGDTYETNADSVYAAQLDYIIYQWNADSTLVADVIAENTIITDAQDIQLNINLDNTYTISWDGVCVDYPEFSEDDCDDLSAGTWTGTTCDFLTEEGCESSFVNGVWDDGSSGVLDENSNAYIMDDVDDDSIFEGTELIFDGSSISITVISTADLCVSLNFTK